MEAKTPYYRLFNEVVRAVVQVENTREQALEKNEPVAPVPRTLQRRQQNRQRRLDRYETVMEKARNGLSQQWRMFTKSYAEEVA
jgi:hypothetical protein